MAGFVIPRLGFSPKMLIAVLEGKQDLLKNTHQVAEAAEFLYSAARGCKRLYGQTVSRETDEQIDFMNYRAILQSSPYAFSQTASEIVNRLENSADCLMVLDKPFAEGTEMVSSYHRNLARDIFYNLERVIEESVKEASSETKK